MYNEEWKDFYGSTAWQQTRRAYASSKRGLCEACLARGIITPGEIVHHKIHLDAETVNDPSVSLSFDNLQLLCRKCHGEQHQTKKRRWKLDKETGKIIF